MVLPVQESVLLLHFLPIHYALLLAEMHSSQNEELTPDMKARYAEEQISLFKIRVKERPAAGKVVKFRWRKLLSVKVKERHQGKL